MNTQHLRYVVEIDRVRSISQAAERLYISQPNLSRVLRDLEADLGFPIFERSSQGVRPTRRGTDFLQHARAILREEEGIRALGAHQAGEERLRVCLPRDEGLLNLTADYLNSLDAEASLNVTIRECHSLQALALVASREAELGVIRFRAEFLEYFRDQTALKELNLRVLRSFDYVALMAAGHPLAARERVDDEALAEYPEIVHGDDLRGGQARRRRRVYTVDRQARRSLLLRIPGAFTLAAPLPAGEAARAGLVERPCDGAGGRYTEALLTNDSCPMSAAGHGFVEFILAAMQPDGPAGGTIL